jgi:hypothetical protein
VGSSRSFCQKTRNCWVRRVLHSSNGNFSDWSLDIQMSDWAPVSPGSKLLTQNLTYIKPLAGSLGPKQTKCEIKHEMVYCDFEEFISTVTTTRTPDVPSGGVFAVKTRTCVMWASPVSSKVVITSQVEWSGRSFIKGKYSQNFHTLSFSVECAFRW